MARKTIHESFDEELQALGLNGGVLNLDDLDGSGDAFGSFVGNDEPDAPVDLGTPQVLGEGAPDPVGGNRLTMGHLDRINALDFEPLEEGDVEELINELAEMEIDENDMPMREAAKATAERLIAEKAAKSMGESASKIVKKYRAGKMSKMRTRLCKPGYRKDPKDPSGRRCIPAAKAAGGKGKLIRGARIKSKWAESGRSNPSQRKSERLSKLRGEEFAPTFAEELAAIMEGAGEVVEPTVRDDIVEHIGNILWLLECEYADDAVSEVFSNAYGPLLDNWDAGRLDEDVVDEAEFKASIEPLMNLISKSLDRLDDQGNL